MSCLEVDIAPYNPQNYCGDRKDCQENLFPTHILNLLIKNLNYYHTVHFNEAMAFVWLFS